VAWGHRKEKMAGTAAALSLIPFCRFKSRENKPEKARKFSYNCLNIFNFMKIS
jgi:hypothetical protein